MFVVAWDGETAVAADELKSGHGDGHRNRQAFGVSRFEVFLGTGFSAFSQWNRPHDHFQRWIMDINCILLYSFCRSLTEKSINHMASEESNSKKNREVNKIFQRCGNATSQ